MAPFMFFMLEVNWLAAEESPPDFLVSIMPHWIRETMPAPTMMP